MPNLDHNDKIFKFWEVFAHKLPVANLYTSIASGLVLGVIFGAAEKFSDQLSIEWGIIGSILFILSIIFFVSGRNSFDWILGKDKYWSVNSKTFVRGLVFFISVPAGHMLIQNIIIMFRN